MSPTVSPNDAGYQDEPRQLAEAVQEMGLKYVVVTSVDRDDLKDSGAGHFAECISGYQVAQPGDDD